MILDSSMSSLSGTDSAIESDGKLAYFKGHDPLSFEESSLQRCKFKITVKLVNPFGCMKQIVYCCCLLCY